MPSLYSNFVNWENSFNTETVSLKRLVETSGRMGSTTTTSSTVGDIVASIQPLKLSDSINLPEGERNRIAFKIYTKDENIRQDDIIERSDGSSFQIKKPLLPYYVNGLLHHYYGFLYNIDEGLL